MWEDTRIEQFIATAGLKIKVKQLDEKDECKSLYINRIFKLLF
jgi:hypothetical protein